ncbi:MAG: radical SAM protein, partial [Deltaproteobacteria bacterium]|nr:radical SAM protein [Deltaproteobacteria bacterium]
MNVVLFEHPRSKSQEHFNDVANAPLSACLTTGYVAAALDGDGIQVEIYDAYLAGHSFSAAGQRIAGSGCDVLGVHAVYFWEQTDRLFELLAAVKAADADVFIVLYGIFPSSFSRQILAAYTCIDAVIIGEPEQVFVELVNQLQKNAGTVAGSISGLVYRQAGRTLAGPPRPLIDPLDRLAFPVRSTLSLNAVGVSVLGSRGCTGRCSFCCVNSFYGREAAWRGRSPANIVAEVTQVLSLVQERYVYFLDADFFGPAKSVHTRVRHLCDLLGDLKLSFGLECRSTDISEKVVQPLAAAGLKHVFLGIESASKAALKRMRKAAGPDRSAVAVELLRSYGIEPNVGFIMFGPDTSLDDVRINFDFLKMCGLLERLHTS